MVDLESEGKLHSLKEGGREIWFKCIKDWNFNLSFTLTDKSDHKIMESAQNIIKECAMY
jgi:hypothetical protein